MKRVMYTLSEVKEKIAGGQGLILAGDEELLKQIPSGKWIAGTIPYFMAENGGVFSTDKICVTEIPSYVKEVSIKKYNAANIEKVFKDAPANGLSVIIIPATSTTHLQFALNAPGFDGFGTKPLIGWISGINLENLGKITPKVFSGQNKEIIEDGAVVMHVTLPDNKYANINIINIFEQSTGDTITFPMDAFYAVDAFINGKKRNFAEYLTEIKADTKLPLVADYLGAMVNTSFQSIDKEQKKVNFYAPIFKGIEYKLAAPVGDYVSCFNEQMPSKDANAIFFSCNCILNYLYSELEGKKTGGVTGPITFGEIAYQLLNQTMVYLTIESR
ncbi:MAG: hypothetical protein V1874_06330 [Spirochaetota bacterium]